MTIDILIWMKTLVWLASSFWGTCALCTWDSVCCTDKRMCKPTTSVKKTSGLHSLSGWRDFTAKKQQQPSVWSKTLQTLCFLPLLRCCCDCFLQCFHKNEQRTRHWNYTARVPRQIPETRNNARLWNTKDTKVTHSAAAPPSSLQAYVMREAVLGGAPR